MVHPAIVTSMQTLHHWHSQVLCFWETAEQYLHTPPWQRFHANRQDLILLLVQTAVSISFDRAIPVSPAQNLELSNNIDSHSSNKILWIVCFLKDTGILAFNRFNGLCVQPLYSFAAYCTYLCSNFCAVSHLLLRVALSSNFSLWHFVFPVASHLVEPSAFCFISLPVVCTS